MLTIKLKIKECLQIDLIDQYCSDYTGMFFAISTASSYEYF